MVHSGTLKRGYWRWMGVRLCPLCRVARVDWLIAHAYTRQLVRQPR